MIRICLIALFACAAVAASAAAQPATVISIKGDAWSRSLGPAWQRLEPGLRLQADAWVRTAPEASVRLIRDDATIIRVPGGVEVRLNQLNALNPDGFSTDFAQILRKLFVESDRRLSAAHRGGEGEDEPEQPPDPAVAHYEQEWRELLAQPRLGREDVARIVETAWYYREPAYRNRAIGLLLRIAHDVPGDPGFSRIAERAAEEFREPAALSVIRVTASGVLPVANGDPVYSGEGLQLRLSSEMETFAYLFAHSLPESGKGKTVRMYPADGNVSQPGPPGGTLYLPGRNAYFIVDDAVGREILWIWVCAAPLRDAAEIGLAQARVAQHIEANRSLGDATTRRLAPSLCPQTFTLELEHR